MTRSLRQRKKKFLKAFAQHHGIVKRAAEAISIRREDFYKWYKEDEDFKRQADAISEGCVDEAEGKLWEHIENDSEKSLHFYLRAKGKQRGYYDKSEVTQDTNINIGSDEPLA